jgi:hypothetical protein
MADLFLSYSKLTTKKLSKLRIVGNIITSVFIPSSEPGHPVSHTQRKYESKYDKQYILDQFNLALNDYLLANETLRVPEIVPYRRTPDYLDVAIRPIRPSFFKTCRPLQPR